MGDYDYTSSVTSMFQYLQWPSLQSRRLRSRLTMLYKIRFGLVDINWKSYLNESNYFKGKLRGHSRSKFLHPHCSLDVFKYSFFPRTCRDWNSLPTDPACHPSLDSFKSAISGPHNSRGGGVLTLTWYTYMCLPFGTLFRENWYSDGGVFFRDEGAQIT